LTLGITVSNFAQSLIAFFIIRRNWREWLTFTFITVAVGVALMLFTNLIYPRWSTFFFSPSDLLYETRHTGNVQRLDAGKRVVLLSKNFFLYNVVAADPMQRIMDKEDREPFPRFNLLYSHPSLAEYRQHRYGPPAIFLWGVLLLGAFASFLVQNRKSIHLSFQLTALALFVFNFALHFDYGLELFLYTPNWTYLLVIFVALSLANLAHHRYMHVFMAACLLALIVNNGTFIRVLANAIQPFLP
jgi:hypothetical protein